jgi:hypothetical protein
MASEPEITHNLGWRTVWKMSNGEVNGGFSKIFPGAWDAVVENVLKRLELWKLRNEGYHFRISLRVIAHDLELYY